jgi:hypothetical protein
MTSIRNGVARLVHDEAGTSSLMEFLVSTAIFLIVVGGAMTLYTVAVADTGTTSATVDAVEGARPKMDQMSRDLRQAASFSASGTTFSGGVAYSDDVTISTYRRGQGFVSVRYNCANSSATRCRKTEGGSTETVLSNLSHLPGQSGYFSWDSTQSPPRLVTLSLRMRVSKRSSGTSHIDLTDGVCLRNVGGLCAS